MRDLNYVLKVAVALFALCGVTTEAKSTDNEAILALSGVKGYGPESTCIQSPGAEGGAYIYAGTALPYQSPTDDDDAFEHVLGDSLEVVFVNHVGRHGARFLSSSKPTDKLTKYLKSLSLTPVGERSLDLCKALDSVTDRRWGALDALGASEQSGIGKRFATRYSTMLSRRDSLVGISSYVPRCVMSMDEMTHSVIWNLRDMELSTGSGPRYNELLRPFETDSAYLAFKKSDTWKVAYDDFAARKCPAAVGLRLSIKGSKLLQQLCSEALSTGVENSGAALEQAVTEALQGEWPAEWVVLSGMTKAQAQDIAMTLYKIVAGSQAIVTYSTPLPEGVYNDWQTYFTEREYEQLWECENLRHYLTYSASALSETPALMSCPLLTDMLESMQRATEPDYSGPGAIVRFGHAETMMPLLALLNLPGCRYVTDNWESVADHWQDFDVVPMAANLQVVLCRSKSTDELYVVTLRNEQLIGAPRKWVSVQREWQKLLSGE